MLDETGHASAKSRSGRHSALVEVPRKLSVLQDLPEVAVCGGDEPKVESDRTRTIGSRADEESRNETQIRRFVRADSKRGEVSDGSCRNHAGSQPILEVSSYDGRMRYAPECSWTGVPQRKRNLPKWRHIGTVDVVLVSSSIEISARRRSQGNVGKNEKVNCRNLLVDSRYSKQRRRAP